MKNILVIITAIFILYSCKDNGTQPPPTKSVRDYTWTADTLAYEGSAQTLMRSIWGSSANDIYICGHNDRSKGNLWHYNGTKWESADIFKTIESTANTLYEVSGTSPNNVWVVGAKVKENPNPPPNFLNQSFIIQYDGSKWIEHKVNTNSAVYSVYAARANDVWACGADGIVYHYNGGSWDIDTIKIPLENNSNFQLKSIVVDNSTEYLLGIKVIENGLKLVDYFYQRNEGTWSVIDSFVTDSQNLIQKWGGLKLYSSSVGKLYSYGIGGIFEWKGNEWVQTYKVSAAIEGMGDKGENDILAVGSRGKVYHYNGSNWQELIGFYSGNSNDIEYTGSWVDDNEAFIIGLDFSGYPQRTIVLHGK